MDNGGSYDSATADALMAKLPSGGYPALYAYENYLAQAAAGAVDAAVRQPDLRGERQAQGVYPQDPDGNIYPENWYFSK